MKIYIKRCDHIYLMHQMLQWFIK